MKKNILLSFVIILIAYLGCVKPCQDAAGLEKSFMVVSPFNVVLDNYFYPQDEFTSPFKKDSLKVINQDGKIFTLAKLQIATDPHNVLKKYYQILIQPAFIIPDDNDAFNQEKTRDIYIHYNYNTIDTLKLVFKAKKNKCGVSTYDYLNVIYKNKVIATKSDNYYIDFQLNH